MKRVDRVARLLKMMQLLQSGRPLEPEKLAESLKVSRRTLFRDLKLLDDAGVGFAFSRRSATYQPKEESLLPPTHLTFPEALALLALLRQGLRQRSHPNPRELASAAVKIESLLPRRLQDTCGPLLRDIEFIPPPESRTELAASKVEYLQRAMSMRLKVRGVYRALSPRELVTSVIRPYRLVHVHRGWYLLGFSEAHSEVRMFKIERFVSIEVTQETYRPDPDFSVERHFGRAWNVIREDRTWRVKLRFSPRVAENVAEIRWHATQRTFRASDGGLIFEVDVDGLKEISWWILGYGDEVRVLQPPALRELIKDRIEGMRALYMNGVTAAKEA
ncbi:MAG: hypothetical protein FLDDKLPJ_01965 [Phycisphaerae bacterium]|nr:hypothetical protein [Phycisphaerae bacterium]